MSTPNILLDDTAAARVDSFLRCVETERRRSMVLRIVACAVVAVLAGVASLTSAGLEVKATGTWIAR